MARTETQHIALGTVAPNFALIDTISNKLITLEKQKGVNGTVILFLCNHCPFVKHINNTISSLANIYIPKGIAFIGISSNDAKQYPEDGPEAMHQVAQEESYIFPYLYDEAQDVAKAYQATCTPDIFLYDKQLKLFYHGQIDNSRPGNTIPCNGEDLVNAMNKLLNSEKPPATQHQGIGCSIKWK